MTETADGIDTPPRPLFSPATVRELLERHGLRPSKSLGQNFLVDGNILAAIVRAGLQDTGVIGGTGVLSSSNSATPATVYEIGPGLGVLTQALARALAVVGGRVIAIEKDQKLAPVLAETLAGLDNVELVLADALEYPFADAPAGSVLVANLPYYVSSAIVTRLLQSGRFRALTFLVQREVAERLAAPVGSDGYGFLSALVAFYGRAERVRDVPKNAFFPVPDVTSSVARIWLDGRSPAPATIKVLEAALHHRRKTLKNNLLLAGYEANAIANALEATGLSDSIRGEVVALADLVKLGELL
jgi:16S rRNA (adenine1518-N6/adenine1519-N6)-dimethyltransferase